MIRFTIRDVLWLTVVVAWCVDRNRAARREAMARENFYRYAPMSGMDIGDMLFSEKMYPPEYHNHGY